MVALNVNKILLSMLRLCFSKKTHVMVLMIVDMASGRLSF